MDNSRAVTAHKDLNIICWNIEQSMWAAIDLFNTGMGMRVKVGTVKGSENVLNSGNRFNYHSFKFPACETRYSILKG